MGKSDKNAEATEKSDISGGARGCPEAEQFDRRISIPRRMTGPFYFD